MSNQSTVTADQMNRVTADSEQNGFCKRLGKAFKAVDDKWALSPIRIYHWENVAPIAPHIRCYVDYDGEEVDLLDVSMNAAKDILGWNVQNLTVPADENWTCVNTLPVPSKWKTATGNVRICSGRYIPAETLKILHLDGEYMIEVDGETYWSHRPWVLRAIFGSKDADQPHVADERPERWKSLVEGDEQRKSAWIGIMRRKPAPRFDEMLKLYEKKVWNAIYLVNCETKRTKS